MSRHPFVSILALTGGAYALWWLFNKKYRSVGADIPCVGSLEAIVRRRNDSIPEILNDLVASHGCIYSIDLDRSKVVIVNSREMIELVGIARSVGLLEEHPCFISRINEAHSCTNTQEMISIATHELKNQCRRAIKCYGNEVHLIGANISIEVNKLVEVFRRHESSDEHFDAFDCIHLACTNVLCSLMFGCRYKYKSRRLKAFTELVHCNLSSKNIFYYVGGGTNNTSRRKTFNKREKIDLSDENVIRNLKKILCFINFEVESHKKDFLVSKYRDFVDIYLRSLCTDGRNSNPISSLSFESTIVDIFTFGSEPVSAHVTWAIYCMVEYPDVQRKCHDEIDQEIGRDKPVTLEDRQKLLYVSATLMEVMRRFTVIPLGLPLLSRRAVRLGPYEIAESSTVVCNYQAVHMDPEVWPDPTTFSPERFYSFQEDKLCRKFFGFGSSNSCLSCPASCLSSKIVFILFANLLQNFHFARNDASTPGEINKCAYDVVKQPPVFGVKIESR